MDLILFGMQGSGKGTVGKALAEKFNTEYFETGAVLRRLANQDSELGQKVKSIIEAGHLVSNEVVMEIVEDFMKNTEENKAIIFDGIPRSVEQAKTLNALLDKYDRDYKAVLLKIVEETALKRLTTRKICKDCKEVYPAYYKKEECEKCGGELFTRADDNPTAIKTRLKAFKKETIPAMEIYKDKLIEIDGEPSIDEVRKIAYKTLAPIMET
ncbi:adenylate kinase [Candidatus Peregrinibacteria bacterium]|nr:adenylate kinase [Candidatus Peregrinibacteria bacterium]